MWIERFDQIDINWRQNIKSIYLFIYLFIRRLVFYFFFNKSILFRARKREMRKPINLVTS